MTNPKDNHEQCFNMAVTTSLLNKDIKYQPVLLYQFGFTIALHNSLIYAKYTYEMT